MTDDIYTVETTFPVRYAETDAMGIVHHASYLVYCEEARTTYTKAKGRTYADMEQDGYHLAVTSVNLKYRRAMRYGQTVRVICWITNLKSRILTFNYELRDADTDELCVTGETEHICLTHAGRPARFPASWLL
jgi:acyl-CoA thioester hydrolase